MVDRDPSVPKPEHELLDSKFIKLIKELATKPTDDTDGTGFSASYWLNDPIEIMNLPVRHIRAINFKRVNGDYTYALQLRESPDSITPDYTYFTENVGQLNIAIVGDAGPPYHEQTDDEKEFTLFAYRDLTDKIDAAKINDDLIAAGV